MSYIKPEFLYEVLTFNCTYLEENWNVAKNINLKKTMLELPDEISEENNNLKHII